MKEIVFSTKVQSAEDDKEYVFICHENYEPIRVGDKYLYFFAGSADVCECYSENEKSEINENDHKSDAIIDLVTGFWKKCYKIKTTNFNLDLI